MAREMDQPIAIRLMHWIHVTSIVLLVWSGAYIHYPAAFGFPGAMNGARSVHFIAMYVIVFNLIWKVYHAVVTGYFKTIWLYGRHLKELPGFFAYHLLMTGGEPPKEGRFNSGQRMTYTLWLFLLIAEAITGFALYGMRPFGWAPWYLARLNWLRELHFLGAWLFVITTVLHVYMVFYDGLHLLRGMITGYEQPQQPQR
ncbi:MAG: cytochrome b/b6 domain-containing protein [Firmicutes bacterium]|nr:cytochrome b/b6 domain-containing protein [Bacillota bacterium]